MARTRWTIGNWKQNLLRGAAEELATAVVGDLPEPVAEGGKQVRVGVAPSYVALETVRPWVRPQGPLFLFAQDVAGQEEGAFTGEVGPAMLLDAGVHGAIVGHSERRAHYGETDASVAAKVRVALEAGLRVVLCVGESLDIREAGTHESYVVSQLSAALSQLPPELVDERLILAYEPVWAIGTGKTATPRDAAGMHRKLRAWMEQHFGPAGADRSILYGGSVKPNNAAALMAAGDVDGFLVGGASLEAEAFLQIVRLVVSAA